MSTPSPAPASSGYDLTPPSAAEGMNKRISGSQLAVIQGAGHMSPMEQQSQVNRALRQFMEEGVTLPHPRMAERSFVLAPLAEVAPDWCHPITGQGAAELLAALPDRGAPKKLA